MKRTARSVLGIVALVTITLFGVVLPAISLIVELVSHWCAEICFDPIPTVYHAIMIGMTVVGNLGLLLVLRGVGVRYLKYISILQAFGLGVAGCYTLLFLPFTPFAFIGLLFFGIGFLPLAPLFSFVCGLILRIRLNIVSRRGDLPRTSYAGFAILLAVCILVALEVPKGVTFFGIQMAADDDPVRQARGVTLLRVAGSDEMLLRACYQRSNGLFGDPVGLIFNMTGDKISTDEIRTIYYRVTGTPFNGVKPPSYRAMRGEWAMDDWDFNQGGDAVQGRLRNLALADSRLDMVADPVAATAYMEWTMVFENKSTRQQEARGQVVLPVGGVVSRLTLWIDGEEREAAFGSRSQVKAAYQKVVQRRRDPVLVTTTGPDRVMVQCFPVPPGGSMKIRIGITAPLDLESLESGCVRLPYFCEQNFNMSPAGTYAVWAESTMPLSAGAATTGLMTETKSDGTYALRGNLRISALEQPCAIMAARPQDARICRVTDIKAPGREVRQQIEEKATAMPARVVIVVDGSRRMRAHRDDMAKTLENLAGGKGELAVVLAGDEVRELMPVKPVTRETCIAAAAAIRGVDFVGGCDNIRALDRAWDLAGNNGVILWLHATQPVAFGGVEGLRQKWERRPDGPRLLAVQFGTGPDVLSQRLDGIAAVQSIARSDAPVNDITRQFRVWNGTATACRYVRTAQATGATGDAESRSAHVVRLWALDEIRAALVSRKAEDQTRAQNLAVTYQLVTPVSGAVVLETKQQYQEAGLEPVAANSVPTIPEPETWLLLIVGGSVLIVFLAIRRRGTRSGECR